MAANKSDYLEDALVNAVLRNTSYTSPATVYVALFTACSSDGSSVTEVSGGSYARKAITFDAPSNGATQNASQVTFDAATADWGTVTHFGIYDASTSGNLLYWGALTASRNITNGSTWNIPDGALTIAET